MPFAPPVQLMALPSYSTFAAALLPVSLTGKRLLDPQLFARLQVKGMPLDLFNDVFLLHLALESPESVFQGFTVLESYFRQTYDTSKPTTDSPAPPSARVLISYELDFQSQAHKAFPTPRSSFRASLNGPDSRTMVNVLAILLAGGAGERLHPLTRDTAKPGVPFGGVYRIVDFTLSNCVNSDVRRIFILTQYKSLELNRHIREGWHIFSSEMGEFVEILPPMKRVSDEWYQGTADAVYQNLQSILTEAPEQVLILSGDHIYKMNYQGMMSWHLLATRGYHACKHSGFS